MGGAERLLKALCATIEKITLKQCMPIGGSRSDRNVDLMDNVIRITTEGESAYTRPVESQLGPWGYKQHGPLRRSRSTGARGGYNKRKLIQNSYKTLVFHNAIFNLLHVNIY